MCLAITGEIIEILGINAKINVMGVETIVNVQLLETVEKGDFVLVHAGCAIEKVTIVYVKELEEHYKLLFNGDEND